MSLEEQASFPEVPKAEFKDTPAKVQYIQCGVLLAGGLTAWLVYSFVTENMLFYYGVAGVAVVAAIVAAVVVQKKYGNQTYLQHFDDRLVLVEDDKVTQIPFEQLQAYAASWTDLYVNGVYSTSTVRLSFDVEGSFRVYQYESTASSSTLKYEQLQALQADASRVIASRRREQLLAEGSVPWTAQLTITTSGLEYRKNGGPESKLIPFPRLGKWQIDSGTFKLAFDEDRRPTVKEPVSQTNFFPGLTLFAELYEQFGQREDLIAEEEFGPNDEHLSEALA